MSELLRLAERCEKATEPTRDLDREILFLVMPKERTHVFDGVKHVSTMTGRDGEFWFNPLADRTDCPHYTGSIDDAMTLIPKDFSVETCHSAAPASSPDLEFTRCRLWDWRRGPLAIDPNNEWKAEGNRPLPLNICAAALRARAHVSSPRESGE